MSETAVTQTLPERSKDLVHSLAIEANSVDSSTKDGSEIKSDLAISPGDHQLTNSTEDGEEYTPEEIKQLEQAGQRLTSEVIEKHNYKKEFDETKKAVQKAMESNLPASAKMRMMEALMEGLKTKMNCVRENNRAFKANIIHIKKKGSMRSLIQSADASGKAARLSERFVLRAEGIESTLNKSGVYQPLSGASSPNVHNKSPIGASEDVNAAKLEEIRKVSEEVKEENGKMEETIAQLKQQRNILLVTIEDLRDDIEDMQYLIKEKKASLDKKVLYTEELRQKISKDSVIKTATRAGNVTHRKTPSDVNNVGAAGRNNFPSAIGEKINDISVSVFNNTVFQDVSSKLTQVFGSFGRALGIKKEDANGDQVLSSDFMKEIGHQNVQPGGLTTGINANKKEQNSSKNARVLSPPPTKSTSSATSIQKPQPRNLSSNTRVVQSREGTSMKQPIKSSKPLFK